MGAANRMLMLTQVLRITTRETTNQSFDMTDGHLVPAYTLFPLPGRKEETRLIQTGWLNSFHHALWESVNRVFTIRFGKWYFIQKGKRAPWVTTSKQGNKTQQSLKDKSIRKLDNRARLKTTHSSPADRVIRWQSFPETMTDCHLNIYILFAYYK